MVRVIANGLGEGGLIPDRVIQNLKKWYCLPPFLTLSIIMYGSRVSGAIQGKDYRLPYSSVL